MIKAVVTDTHRPDHGQVLEGEKAIQALAAGQAKPLASKTVIETR